MEEPEIEQVETKKSALLKRMQEKYPDLNPEDEEALYDKILGEYGEYDAQLGGYKQNEEQLIGLFNKNPKAASFLLDMKEGKDPVAELIRQYGDDITAIIGDPEKLEEFSKAREDYMKKVLDSKALDEQASANSVQMLENLDAAQAEGGYTDEQVTAAFEAFNKILDDALVHNVSKETWMMMLKGLNHDEDIAAAAHEAEIKGRNAKIDAIKKKTSDANMPPALGGQSGSKNAAPQSEGAFGRYSGQDIYERGGFKKVK